jgi:hypothetical protein
MEMWFKYSIILSILAIFITDFGSAQEIPAQKDSTHIYKAIETYSKKSKLTTFVYGLILKPTAPKTKINNLKKKTVKKPIQKPYSIFEGKIIRNIDIITLDPFGYSAIDTSVAKQNYLYKAGNWLHIKTQGITIRNLILIHRNEPFNTLLVRESERLIRSQKYVHEVSFYVRSAGKKSDSVDIVIRELDLWSIIPEGSASPTGFEFGFTENNFLGAGHEFKNSYTRDITHGINSLKTNYFIPNIRNTYINSTLHYGVDDNKNFKKILAFDRPFFSPIAKWAAGVSFSQTEIDSMIFSNLVFVPLRLRFNTQDYWAGGAQQIFKGNSEDELSTSLILTARYLRIQYFGQTSELYDPFHIYSSENFYLAGIAISTRKYIQDKYIYNSGVTEDVPIGRVYGVTFGYQVKNNSGRIYVGMRFSEGTYNDWGYLSYNLEYGTFLRATLVEQGVFSGGATYFTRLMVIGKWKFRQFVKPQVTIGVNRLAYDSLTLKDGYGLDGFNSSGLTGTTRLVFTLQTQSYAPWNFIGFHFGPYVVYSIGMLGDALTGFTNSKLFSQLGIGVLIRNENLIISTFQFSFSFYPVIPGTGHNVFKFNSFKTSDLGFRDFKIGKPDIVVFQ